MQIWGRARGLKIPNILGASPTSPPTSDRISSHFSSSLERKEIALLLDSLLLSRFLRLRRPLSLTGVPHVPIQPSFNFSIEPHFGFELNLTQAMLIVHLTMSGAGISEAAAEEAIDVDAHGK